VTHDIGDMGPRGPQGRIGRTGADGAVGAGGAPGQVGPPGVNGRSPAQKGLRRAGFLALLATLANLSVVAVVYVDYRATNNEQQAEQSVRSVNSCLDRNDIRIGMNRLALSAFGHDPDTGQPTEAFLAATPEQQATVADRLTNLLPLQDCTVEALERYNASGRREGVIPIDGSDGYLEAVTQP
jgi:hypothetical protein